MQFYPNQVNTKGAFMLEAPITGGLEALKKGQMTVFMAGEKDLAEQVSSFLQQSISKITFSNLLCFNNKIF